MTTALQNYRWHCFLYNFFIFWVLYHKHVILLSLKKDLFVQSSRSQILVSDDEEDFPSPGSGGGFSHGNVMTCFREEGWGGKSQSDVPASAVFKKSAWASDI